MNSSLLGKNKCPVFIRDKWPRGGQRQISLLVNTLEAAAETATRGVLLKKVSLKISQILLENTVLDSLLNVVTGP